jgi:hypothetical protein
MPISPQLLRKLRETLGVDAADDLVSRLEDMDSIRGDIGELRHEMELGFARIEARLERFEGGTNSKFQTFEAKMEAMMEKGLREQTRFFFLAWSVLLAAIVGLYAR